MTTTNVDVAQEIVAALAQLLAQRQESVLRLEALECERSAVRKQLDELDAKQEVLLDQLKEQIGPPVGTPLSSKECSKRLV